MKTFITVSVDEESKQKLYNYCNNTSRKASTLINDWIKQLEVEE